jgi:hypothetical protein
VTVPLCGLENVVHGALSITGQERAVSANHRTGESGVSQSEDRRERCQPITGQERAVSANHRTGESGVSQSQDRRERCQPLTRRKREMSANCRRALRLHNIDYFPHLVRHGHLRFARRDTAVVQQPPGIDTAMSTMWLPLLMCGDTTWQRLPP